MLQRERQHHGTDTGEPGNSWGPAYFVDALTDIGSFPAKLEAVEYGNNNACDRLTIPTS